MITTAQLNEKYGVPTIEGAGLVTIKLPYPMRLAWDLKTTVTKMRCHNKVADQFTAVFKEILEVYGLPKIQELGIDLFGGCFNYRQMRGGNSWSLHSWGIAIDLDPERNGLRTKWKDAQFSKSEYKAMIDIFYYNGFINLGKEKNRDAMHFEIKE